MKELDHDTIHRAVQQIYDAAINPFVWQSFMEDTVKNLNGTAGFMIMLDTDNPINTLSFQSSFPEEVYNNYLRDFYLEGDIWYQIASKRSNGETFIGSEFIDDKDLVQTPFYNVCLEPMNAGRVIACSVDASPNKAFGVSISRPFNKEDFTSLDKEYFSLLAPHLTRARFLHSFLKKTEQEKLFLHEALHKTTSPLILFNKNKSLIFINHSAEKFLNQSNEIIFMNGGIRFKNYNNQKEFEKHFNESNSTTQSKGYSAGGSIKILNSAEKVAYHIVVTPLNPNTDHDQLYTSAAVGVFIIVPETNHPLSAILLQDLYDLSPAESKLTQLLFSGKSLLEICEINSVKMSTVKSQLQKVFEKTGTNSQSELMRILAQGLGLISND